MVLGLSLEDIYLMDLCMRRVVMTMTCSNQAAPSPSLLVRLAEGVLRIVYSWPYKPPLTVEELSYRMREDFGGPHHLRW